MGIPSSQLEKFCAKVFSKLGVPLDHAKIAARVLTEADLRGTETHGVARLPIYAKRLQLNLINKQPRIRATCEVAGGAIIDGDNGLGQVVAHGAMSLCIEKARKNGVAFVAVNNSNHFGIGAYYAMMALEKDMIGVVTTNTSPLMAPFGGKEAFLGTNPMAISVPAGKENPIVLDMATSLVSRGKIEMYARKGEDIPLGWAIDADGLPTANPIEALKGTLLPMGGPKGYGLSLIVDILSGVLAGAAVGNSIGSLFGNMDRPQNVGHFMMAIDIAKFRPLHEFKDAMDKYIISIKESAPAKGVQRIFLPGEIEFLKAKERMEKGISINPIVVQELLSLAKVVGLVGKETGEEMLFA